MGGGIFFRKCSCWGERGERGSICWGGDCSDIFGGGKGGGGSVESDGRDGGGSCGCGCVWVEGPASGWGFSGHIFFAAPSPLSLLLFKLVVVSISSVWFAGFLFFIFLDVVDAVVANGTVAVDVVGVAGVADIFGVVLGAGVGGTFGVVVAGVFGDSGAAGGWTLSCLWGGDVFGFSSSCLGDPFLFRFTSVQPSCSFVLGWTWLGPWASACLLMVVVVVAAESVVVVAATFSFFCGQNLAMWPICHPVSLEISRSFLVALPSWGALLGRLYRAVNKDQFAPIRLSCVVESFWGVAEVVDPSMTAEKFAARRVKLSLHLLQEWRGGFYFKTRRQIIQWKQSIQKHL